ncbi:TetR/AcrR family transcriptional regulator [Thermopolyspora sp. NPDC052614]|uniref:TetR/AcrR family transcriptional regulator n=1 Tax=Thermopolyspora sp. NPDC052614 TaxID=3155682 RepID=UPI0034451F72
MSGPTRRRGPGRPPGSDSAETRAKILHSARQVFSTIGFDQASLKQIAEDAGLTRNAIANYYSSKSDLYLAALASVQEVAVEKIIGRASAVEGPAYRRVMMMVQAAAEFGWTDRTFVRFFITATVDATRHPELRDEALLPLQTARDFVWETLDAAQRKGEIAPDVDTEAITQVVGDLLWGLAMDIGFYTDRERMRRTVRAFDRLLSAELAPVPGDIPKDAG